MGAAYRGGRAQVNTHSWREAGMYCEPRSVCYPPSLEEFLSRRARSWREREHKATPVSRVGGHQPSAVPSWRFARRLGEYKKRPEDEEPPPVAPPWAVFGFSPIARPVRVVATLRPSAAYAGLPVSTETGLPKDPPCSYSIHKPKLSCGVIWGCVAPINVL